MRKTINTAMIAGLCMAPSLANAADVSLSIALDDQASVSTETYKCSDGGDYAVRYVNSGSNSLALIKLKDEELIFVGVISASGARYQSGAYEWWSKGDEATLSNAMDEGAKLSCKASSSD
jgi:membrane-bound inhibitor of C-type lysozyme